MSTTEILAQLPALPTSELEAIWKTAGRLIEGRAMTATPELIDAIAEADAERAAQPDAARPKSEQ